MPNRYGARRLRIARPVLARGGGELYVCEDAQVVNVFFILPPTGRSKPSWFATPNHTNHIESYTPQVFLPPQGCLMENLRSTLTNCLPSRLKGHPVELFTIMDCTKQGWYHPYQAGLVSTLLASQGSEKVKINEHESILVSVKVRDEAKGCMLVVDPFPSPACPPRFLMCSPAPP